MSLSPPVESDWPIYLTTTVVINAPQKKVWDTLVDFSAYARSHTDSRKATLLDGSKKPLPGPNPPLAKGNYIGLDVHMPPSMDDSIKPRALTEVIMQVEPERQLVWGSARSAWLFGAQRWHTVTEIDAQTTKLEIIAVFSGLGPGLAKAWMRTTVTACVEGMAAALKRRCE
ncbi:hypothetical protein B0H16DRAFT_1328010 [Mycena metata]|uniref:Polyketide cyclase/dehydrase n=1 Tax=Mycena metata TaxID=1033252 RepID=A0AAD7I2Q8_9AGAR|nr:hypothetical protein B0H16DRAFT_1328010 [Mycena metata]